MNTKHSISDDDLCSSCARCSYNSGELCSCSLGFPGNTDQDGYVVHCDDFEEIKPLALGISKTEYRKARRMLRDNGRAALKWLDGMARDVMERLIDERNSTDMLAERADVVAYCERVGTYHTALHTVDLGLLNRFYDRKNAA